MQIDLVWTILYYIFTALYIYTAFVVLAIVVLENRNPVKTLAWIMILVMLPIVGIIIYAFVGQDFRRKKIIKDKLSHHISRKFHSLNIEHIDKTDIPPRMQKLVNLLSNNCGALLYPGNQIEVFTTGKSTFDSLFADIENAEEHIHIEFYIIGNDEVGNYLRDLLIFKALQGVRVRVIYDYFGGWQLPLLWRKDLKDAGVFIEPFLPAKNVFGFSKVNYRNHRKLVVIDGKIAYTGGVNVAERYRNGNRLGLWRDTFIRVQGAAVHAMQYSFLSDWNFVDHKSITAEKYYPVPQFYDNNFIQIVPSGPDTDWQNIMQGITCAISSAQHSIYIHTPYCMPPEGLMTAIETAAISGIDVRLMVPERNDSRLVAAAGRSYLEQLLRAGVSIYFYQNNFLHSKAIVVDGYLSIIGTANMDNRSYDQNFEIAAFVYDYNTAQTMMDNFENDMLTSRQLNLNLWHHRPRMHRLKESVARLFSPLL